MIKIERHVVKKERGFEIIRCDNGRFVWWEIYSDHYPFYYSDGLGGFKRLKDAEKKLQELLEAEG